MKYLKKMFMVSALFAAAVFGFYSTGENHAIGAGIPVTFVTVDASGVSIRGSLYVAYPGFSSNWMVSPQIYNIPEGALVVLYGHYLDTRSDLVKFNVYQDTTYKIDGKTGLVTAFLTPGVNSVEFMFEPVSPVLTMVSKSTGRDLLDRKLGGSLRDVKKFLTGSLADTKMFIDSMDF